MSVDGTRCGTSWCAVILGPTPNHRPPCRSLVCQRRRERCLDRRSGWPSAAPQSGTCAPSRDKAAESGRHEASEVARHQRSERVVAGVIEPHLRSGPRGWEPIGWATNSWPRAVIWRGSLCALSPTLPPHLLAGRRASVSGMSPPHRAASESDEAPVSGVNSPVPGWYCARQA